MSNFNSKIGDVVAIDDIYLNDEVGQQAGATSRAEILSTPSDPEELVMVVYTNGLVDFVPQGIIIKL